MHGRHHAGYDLNTRGDIYLCMFIVHTQHTYVRTYIKLIPFVAKMYNWLAGSNHIHGQLPFISCYLCVFGSNCMPCRSILCNFS